MTWTPSAAGIVAVTVAVPAASLTLCVVALKSTAEKPNPIGSTMVPLAMPSISRTPPSVTSYDPVRTLTPPIVSMAMTALVMSL